HPDGNVSLSGHYGLCWRLVGAWCMPRARFCAQRVRTSLRISWRKHLTPSMFPLRRTGGAVNRVAAGWLPASMVSTGFITLCLSVRPAELADSLYFVWPRIPALIGLSQL